MTRWSMRVDAAAPAISVISPPWSAVRVVLVVIRCFQAAADSAGRRSEPMPGWWSSRSRQNSRPSA